MMDDVQFQKSNFAIMLEFPEKNDVFKNGISDALSHDDSSVQIPAVNKSYTKAFECKKCVKVLSSKSSLLRHLRQVHHGVRPFQCEQCLKSFTQKITLFVIRDFTANNPPRMIRLVLISTPVHKKTTTA